jgi:hypothetical protein
MGQGGCATGIELMETTTLVGGPCGRGEKELNQLEMLSRIEDPRGLSIMFTTAPIP